MTGRSPEIDTEALLRKVLWTPEDLAAFLDLPVATIYNQRSAGQLCPGYRFGKHLRFERDEVLAWIGTRRNEAPARSLVQQACKMCCGTTSTNAD